METVASGADSRAVSSQPVPNRDLMTTAEVAAYLHRSVARTRELMGGRIPATKVGRHWLARRSDVDAYVDAGRTTAKVRPRRGRGKRGAA